jgi:hypothetical protein
VIVDAAPVCAQPKVVVPARIGPTEFQVLPPESSRFSVVHGQLIAVPLYDGMLRSNAEWKTVLRYLGTVTVPANECIRTAAGSAASHRLALFRVIGQRGEGATVLVGLKLPALRERCVSCRTVHFFVHIR